MKALMTLLAGMLLLLLNVSAAVPPRYALTSSGPQTEVSPGEDWSLPEGTERSYLSGLFQMSGEQPLTWIPEDLDDLVDCYGITLTWARLHPQENGFDFFPLESALDIARAQGRCLVLRLKNHVVDRQSPWNDDGVPYIPAWVLNKCDPPVFYTKGSEGEDAYIRAAAPWDECVTSEYLRFIVTFGQQGLLARPELKGLYVHGISSSFGEEMWLTPAAVQTAEALGMTAQLLEDAYEARFEAWASAAELDVDKLAWVSATIPSYSGSEEYLNRRAAELGLGVRSGGMETYNAVLDSEWGVLYNDSNQKMYLDESWEYRDYRRYLGGEDENFVNDSAYDEWFKSTVFVESFLGSSFIWLPGDYEFLRRNRAVLDWFALRGGKRLAQSPDVAIWLRENYRRRAPDCLIVKNAEIGVYQLDGDGKATIPTEKYDRSGLQGGEFWTDCNDNHYDYLARRTDITTGNDTIALALDDRFKNALVGRSLAIKVVFIDNSNASWRLETGSGVVGDVQNQYDGQTKTATFIVDASELETRFSDGADFRLVVLGGGDLTAKIVRVVKLPGRISLAHAVYLPALLKSVR